MRPDSPLPTFKQIGKYKIEGLISHGGMSLLYLASDPYTQKPLIIKVLLPKYCSQKDIRERFLNEARVISLANHPNIVQLVDSGTWENGLYIAMEFVKGSSLRKIFQHQPYALKRAMDVLLQIAYALSHLHAHGVVHGDLKPENILIDEHGQVKVIDFGIARVLTDEIKDMPSRFLGTPIYMSPELGIDRDKLSFQSDIFALGIIAYELAVGKISHGRIIISLAPKGLQKLIQKALQPNVIDRYSDMCDFIADLSSYIKSGALEKDKQGSDQFLEIFEKLETIQNDLLSHEPPSWDNVKVDLAVAGVMGLTGTYIDFFEPENKKKLIFIAKSNKSGAEALIEACMIKASLKTLLALKNTSEIPAFLVDQIEKNFFSGSFSFAYLVIDQQLCEFSYYHNGFGMLAIISENHDKHVKAHIVTDLNTASSTALQHIKGTYQENDSLLFFGTNYNKNMQTLLDDAVKDALTNIPNQAEAILRKIRLKNESIIEEQLFSVILLHFL